MECRESLPSRSGYGATFRLRQLHNPAFDRQAIIAEMTSVLPAASLPSPQPGLGLQKFLVVWAAIPAASERQCTVFSFGRFRFASSSQDVSGRPGRQNSRSQGRLTLPLLVRVPETLMHELDDCAVAGLHRITGVEFHYAKRNVVCQSAPRTGMRPSGCRPATAPPTIGITRLRSARPAPISSHEASSTVGSHTCTRRGSGGVTEQALPLWNCLPV